MSNPNIPNVNLLSCCDALNIRLFLIFIRRFKIPPSVFIHFFWIRKHFRAYTVVRHFYWFLLIDTSSQHPTKNVILYLLSWCMMLDIFFNTCMQDRHGSRPPPPLHLAVAQAANGYSISILHLFDVRNLTLCISTHVSALPRANEIQLQQFVNWRCVCRCL